MKQGPWEDHEEPEVSVEALGSGEGRLGCLQQGGSGKGGFEGEVGESAPDRVGLGCFSDETCREALHETRPVQCSGLSRGRAEPSGLRLGQHPQPSRSLPPVMGAPRLRCSSPDGRM